jgi:hypothetical protein
MGKLSNCSLTHTFNKMEIVISIVIGLVVWKVVPILTNGAIRKKSYRKATSMFCEIVGVAIIVMSILNYLKSLTL